MTRSIVRIAALVALILCARAAAAATVILSTATAHTGDRVTIGIAELDDGSFFDLTITSTSTRTSDAEWCNLTDFAIPFALSNGSFVVTASNVDRVRFEAVKGHDTVAIEKIGTGTVTIAENRSIPNGTFDRIRVLGDVRDAASPVSVSFAAAGTKRGPCNAELAFTVAGTGAGEVRISVAVDGSTILSAPLAIVSMDPARAAGSRRFSSADGSASLAVVPGASMQDAARRSLDGAAVVDLDPDDVPSGAGTLFTGRAYRCYPEGATVDPPAVFSVSLSPSEWRTNLSLYRYDNADGVWVALPTEIDAPNRTISAPIGIFCVVGVFAETMQDPPQGAGVPVGIIAAGLVFGAAVLLAYRMIRR